MDDVDTQTLGLNSLANTFTQRGRFREAVRIHQQALKLARRHHLHDREGEVLHDMFVATWAAGDREDAEQYARLALERYKHGHRRLPTLAHDVAFSWVETGYFSRALSVLESLPEYFPVLDERVRVLASTARAAAGCGNVLVFERSAREIGEIMVAAPSTRGFAAALVQLAIGATGLERWSTAENALRQAIEIANERCEPDVVAEAEELLTRVGAHGSAELLRHSMDYRPEPQMDELVDTFLASLGPALAAAEYA